MGNFLADFYSVNGLVLESRKRREHLSEEDILRNKAIMESLSKGGNLIEQNFEVSWRGGFKLGLNKAVKFSLSSMCSVSLWRRSCLLPRRPCVRLLSV